MHASGLVSGNYGVGNAPDVEAGDRLSRMVVENYVAPFASLMSVQFFDCCCTARNSVSALWSFVRFTAVESGDLQPVCESFCGACVEFSWRYSL